MRGSDAATAASCASTHAVALTPHETSLMRRWLSRQGAWVPTWVRTDTEAWNAVRITGGASSGVTITVVLPPPPNHGRPAPGGVDIVNTDTVRDARAHMYPTVCRAYVALTAYIAVRNRANNLSSVHDIVDMHAIYIAHPRKRVLPARDKVITPDHINGGFTTFGAPQPVGQPWRVLVYRAEDATKVMLHEMMHLLHLDGDQVPAAVENAWARRHVVVLAPPQQSLSIREAVAETLACFVYAAATSRSAAAARAACARMGRRIDAIAADLLDRAPPFADGTHAFAYTIARAALWDGENGACDELLRIVERGSEGDLLPLLDVRIPALCARLHHTIGPRHNRPQRRMVGLGLVEFKNKQLKI